MEVAEYLSFREELAQRWGDQLSTVSERAVVGHYVRNLPEERPSTRFVKGRSRYGLPESRRHPIGDRATGLPHFRSDCVPEGVFVAERNLVGSRLLHKLPRAMHERAHLRNQSRERQHVF